MVQWPQQAVREGFGVRTPEHYESDLLFYFDGRPVEFSLYQRLVQAMDRAFPDASVKVQKSQISFYCPRLFAAASIPVRRKKDWPRECLLVTFGLERQLLSPRIAVAVEPYPNRWTHHVVVSRPEEIDEELLEWLTQAYQFAQVKGSRR